MNSYCVRCKRQTGTSNVKIVSTRNGKRQARGLCAVCGCKKRRFVSSKSGKGLVGNMLGIGKVPILGDLPLIGGLF